MPDEFDPDRWAVPLNPPVFAATTGSGASSAAPGGRGEDRPAGFLVTHPRYRAWLARCGVTSADAALALPGEVVSGHADRHVVRVELHGGSGHRVVYLKREHVAGRRPRLRNRLAGFGWVSRSEREAMTLAKLEAAGMPGPQWLAYGEDAAGRGFLLVDELAGAVELRAFLADNQLTPEDRRLLAERIGRTLAELHEAGFGTPELAAKHLFVHPGTLTVTPIDWQNSATVEAIDRARWFAALHATLADELADPADRLRVLWAYRRTVRMTRGRGAKQERFGATVRQIVETASRLVGKSSVRFQRGAADVAQRLVWLDGEAAVAIPEVAAVWPTPAAGEPFYAAHGTPSRERITFADGRSAVLVRTVTTDPLGRLTAAVRERPWRSPSATAARVLFHLQRHGIPAPRLLAFGQRVTSRTAAESFLVAELPPTISSLSVVFARPELPLRERGKLLRGCGRLLRLLHDAGCRPASDPGPDDPLFLAVGDTDLSVEVGSPFAVRLVKRVSESARRSDLRRSVAGLSRTDRARLLAGYEADRAARKSLARGLRAAWA
jgi:tRNA A-37 threonylcarbamoyl transferase component Bud32